MCICSHNPHQHICCCLQSVYCNPDFSTEQHTHKHRACVWISVNLNILNLRILHGLAVESFYILCALCVCILSSIFTLFKKNIKFFSVQVCVHIHSRVLRGLWPEGRLPTPCKGCPSSLLSHKRALYAFISLDYCFDCGLHVYSFSFVWCNILLPSMFIEHCFSV